LIDNKHIAARDGHNGSDKDNSTRSSSQTDIDTLGRIVLDIRVIYVLVIRFNEEPPQKAFLDAIRHLHCQIWPSFGTKFDIDPEEICRVTPDLQSLYNACATGGQKGIKCQLPDIQAVLSSKNNIFDNTSPVWRSRLGLTSALHDGHTFYQRSRLVFIGSGFDVVATNNDSWSYAASMFSKFDVEIATVLPVSSKYLNLHRQLSG
jgi:hypothetical protein